MEKSKTPKYYCEYCGEKMVKAGTSGFDPYTGEQTFSWNGPYSFQSPGDGRYFQVEPGLFSPIFVPTDNPHTTNFIPEK